MVEQTRSLFRVRRVRALMVVLASLVLLALAGCGGAGSGNGTVAPAPAVTETESTPSPSGTPTSPFAKADAQIAELVQAPVSWHAPDRLAADESADLGLSIGSTAELRQRIAEVLPGTITTPGGTVRVSPDAAAVLVVDPQEAVVEPNGRVNASTGSDIGLLWTWKVHPLRPSSALHLTARIEVLLPETGQPLIRYVELILPVDRTVRYTATQVFTNWATWVSIVTVVAGWVAFVWRRRTTSHRTPGDGAVPQGTAPPPDPQPDASSPT
ncbi:hypothetical protein [Humibacillus xanthopallidus]|uniref:Uncharacterized protein n=1 Tax=Humibacillus xanthopallidus TaxID=412689 RepID=A0A543HWD5_9MICO|nr:hypothetical protein [Humibacillus xanthopallidus]TQM62602.1 hypothetical protein FBY41_2639 [Humibacillus xanthopallidus]